MTREKFTSCYFLAVSIVVISFGGFILLCTKVSCSPPKEVNHAYVIDSLGTVSECHEEGD